MTADEQDTSLGFRLASLYADVLPDWRGLAADINNCIASAVEEAREQWDRDSPARDE